MNTIIKEKKPIVSIIKSKKILNQLKSLTALILLGAIFSLLNENFLTFNNIRTIAQQTSHVAILAIAETLVIITGGIDLSAGSILAVAGVITGKLLLSGVPIWASVLIGIITGGICGLINGLVISKMKLVPFIATLGMMNIARGIAYILTNSLPVSGLPSGLYFLGGGAIKGIPVPVIITVVLALLISFTLRKTTFGRRIFAIGSGREAARLSGVSVGKTEIGVFTLSGLLAGLVGVILAARVVSAQPNAGIGYESDGIAAAIIGGTSPSGGVGSIFGTITGALVIGVLKNGLSIMQINPFWQQTAIGLIIIIAVYIDRLRKKN